jgi:hypothetical protein
VTVSTAIFCAPFAGLLPGVGGSQDLRNLVVDESIRVRVESLKYELSYFINGQYLATVCWNVALLLATPLLVWNSFVLPIPPGGVR